MYSESFITLRWWNPEITVAWSWLNNRVNTLCWPSHNWVEGSCMINIIHCLFWHGFLLILKKNPESTYCLFTVFTACCYFILYALAFDLHNWCTHAPRWSCLAPVLREISVRSDDSNGWGKKSGHWLERIWVGQAASLGAPSYVCIQVKELLSILFSLRFPVALGAGSRTESSLMFMLFMSSKREGFPSQMIDWSIVTHLTTKGITVSYTAYNQRLLHHRDQLLLN